MIADWIKTKKLKNLTKIYIGKGSLQTPFRKIPFGNGALQNGAVQKYRISPYSKLEKAYSCWAPRHRSVTQCPITEWDFSEWDLQRPLVKNSIATLHLALPGYATWRQRPLLPPSARKMCSWTLPCQMRKVLTLTFIDWSSGLGGDSSTDPTN